MLDKITFKQTRSLRLTNAVIIFELFDLQFWWPWTRTLQGGHPMSKVIVSIESPFIVSYLTSIVSNIVSLVLFEISDAEVLWPGSRTVQGHPRSKVMVPIDSPWRLSIRLLLTPTSYLSQFLKYLTCNFDDLKLGQFKVIHGQRSWCQLMAQGRFHNRLPLTSSWYLCHRFRDI